MRKSATIDASTLQAMTPTMRAHVLKMYESGQVHLFDHCNIDHILESCASASWRDKPYISVADTCRLLNGEVTIPGLGRIGRINIL
jgi:hypothetical protein